MTISTLLAIASLLISITAFFTALKYNWELKRRAQREWDEYIKSLKNDTFNQRDDRNDNSNNTQPKAE